MKLPFKLPSIKLPALKLPKFGKKKEGDEDDDDDFDFDPSDFEGDPDASLGDLPETPGEGGGLDDDAGDDFNDLDDLLETPVGGDDEKAPLAAEAGDSAIPTQAEAELSGAEQATASDGEVPVDDLDLGDDLKALDFDDDDNEDEEGEEGKSKLDPKRKKLLIIGGGATAGVLLIGGLTWFFLSGDGEAGKSAEQDSAVPKVEITLAPKKEKVAGNSLNAIAAGVKGPGEGVSVPATSPMIFASVQPPAVTDGPLNAATDPTFIEEGSQGPMPKIAPDGRMPWKVYAKPFDVQDARPRVAIVVRGLGMSEAATDAAIRLLPGNVTLAFNPYAPNIESWAEKARQTGHEILVMQPLEPSTFPKEDPGPQGLMTTNDPDENKFRLEYVLSRVSGYIGVMTSMGSKFNQSEDHLGIFLNQLKARGLMLMDGDEEQKSLAPKMATEMGVPMSFIDIVLDDVPTQSAIDAQLVELEGILAQQPAAVAVINAYPYSIERVAAWTAGLEAKKLVLAPLSNLANKQILQ